jgi:hypothetical protein
VRTRSTGRSTSVRRGAAGVDVYLFPAVVGGGLGDIEEVLAAGRRLAEVGFRVILYRRAGHPLPRSVDGPWAWPALERRTRLLRRHAAALTIAPSWGVSAAPSRPGAYGRGGAWEEEARDVEAAYGVDRTVHVSLEEFARTAPSVVETRERLREGGVAARAIPARLASARSKGEVAEFHAAFRRFRGFDRPNVLHLFATFRADPSFGREFPEAVQTGPLWPRRYARTSSRRRRGRRREWVWYASPASAEAIAPALAAALARTAPDVHLFVRTPRPWSTPLPGGNVTLETRPVGARAWEQRFRAAELRIVTGSRTLLEAIEVAGPFLYFNGVLATGTRRRRHRPEKIAALLALGGDVGIPADLRKDLADFARGRRIGPIVARAAVRAGGWSHFPTFESAAFPAPYEDAGELLVAVARSLGGAPEGALALVARVRARSHP